MISTDFMNSEWLQALDCSLNLITVEISDLIFLHSYDMIFCNNFHVLCILNNV